MSRVVRPARGASGIRLGRSARFERWLRRHQFEAVDAFRRLVETPVASLLTLLMLAVALALPGFSMTLLANLEKLSPSSDLDPQIALYLNPALSDAEVDRFSRELLLRDDLLSVELISSSKGAADFRDASELGALLDLFAENPLPAVILVVPRDQAPATLSVLREELGAKAEVEVAELDLEWLERLGAILSVFERISLILALMLGLTVLLVVANTVRMMISARLSEIEISLLIGATPAWVRRPFLYAGLWYGLSGGLIALFLIYFALALIEVPLSELTTLYLGFFEFEGPGLMSWLYLIGGGGLLGWSGAYIAVSRQLNQFAAD